MSPRKRKRRHVGCYVAVRDPGGRLRLRFRWNGVSFCEVLDLFDTPDNRERASKLASVIGAEIQNRTFDYAARFPNGSKIGLYRRPDETRREVVVQKKGGITVAEYYADWIALKDTPAVRRSRIRDYKQHFRAYLEADLGDIPLEELTLGAVQKLKANLERQGLAQKTIRNAIDSTLRALCRDARLEGFELPCAFERISWERQPTKGPTPFSAEERDLLLSYYAKKSWKVGGFNEKRAHFPYYAYLFTLFYTGARPSELAAVRIKAADLRAATIQVEASRHLGSEAAPKTRSAQRTVHLTRQNVAVLEPLIPLKADPEDYLFKNVWGGPIKPEDFYDAFVDAERALGLRLRDLYSTKDTYISLALSAEDPVNITWLSEQTGVNEATLKKHYGRFMHTAERDALELEKIGGIAPPLKQERRRNQK